MHLIKCEGLKLIFSGHKYQVYANPHGYDNQRYMVMWGKRLVEWETIGWRTKQSAIGPINIFYGVDIHGDLLTDDDIGLYPILDKTDEEIIQELLPAEEILKG